MSASPVKVAMIEKIKKFVNWSGDSDRCVAQVFILPSILHIALERLVNMPCLSKPRSLLENSNQNNQEAILLSIETVGFPNIASLLISTQQHDHC